MEWTDGSDSYAETTKTTMKWEVKQPDETAETTEEETAQQERVTEEVKQPRPLVKQGVTAETTEKETVVTPPEKQAGATGATVHTKESETVVFIDSNVKYLKQKCRQAYKRMRTQEDPTTPEKNYKQLKSHLEIQGYQVEPTPQEGKPFFVDIFKPITKQS